MIYVYNETEVNYNVYGDGENLLIFLHGWGGSGQVMLPIAKPFFNSNNTILTIDFPPFGESTEPTTPWTLYDYVNLTKEIIELITKQKDFINLTIIGHSFGGRVAIVLAGEKLIPISKLVLISSAGIKPKFSLLKTLKIYEYKFLKKIKSPKANKFGSSDYKQLSSIMKKTFSNIINFNLSNISKNISINTLIISGTKDTETPLYMAKKLNKNIPTSKLVTIKNGSHFAYLEYPQYVNLLLSTFLYT